MSLRAEPGVIAITGATGFIGSYLLSHLDRLGLPSRVLMRDKRNRTFEHPASTKVIPGSLNDLDAISTLLEGAKTCIHAAGATKSVNANEFHTANVIGTFNMAASAVAAGVEHFIYLSSQAARAPWLSDYAASKATSEAALQPFRSQMRITIIRPPAVIGAGDPMLQPMFDLMRYGWLPTPSERGEAVREFALISVQDLVEQVIKVVQSEDPHDPILEPCSIPATNWKDIAQVSSEVLAHKVRLLPIWPSLLKTVGYCADGLSRLVRRPMPISHGKVQELLAADWTYDHPVRDAMNLSEIFERCLFDQRA